MPDIQGVENDVFHAVAVNGLGGNLALLEGLHEGGKEIPEGQLAPLKEIYDRLGRLLQIEPE